jgi:hypothetical protein
MANETDPVGEEPQSLEALREWMKQACRKALLQTWPFFLACFALQLLRTDSVFVRDWIAPFILLPSFGVILWVFLPMWKRYYTLRKAILVPQGGKG